MLNRQTVFAILAGTVSILAADPPSTDKSWQKPVPEWTADDAHQVLTDSPWVKTTNPTMDKAADEGQRRGGGGGRGSRGRGIGIGGVSIGLPGVGGMGRRGGGGYPGGGNSGGGYPGGAGRGRTDTITPPTLTLRWESALPVREAELKAREVDAPTVDEKHYAIAVFGVPRNMLKADTRSMEKELRKVGALKRDGKKDFKPSSVEIHQRDDGAIILYLFPKSTEITKSDRRIEFDAQIGRLKFAEPFFTEDMVYDGKPAL